VRVRILLPQPTPFLLIPHGLSSDGLLSFSLLPVEKNGKLQVIFEVAI
jgi:hypothetical protein